MVAKSFNCPKCGGPLTYDGSDISTMQCPFCNSTVIIPAELRPAKIRKQMPRSSAPNVSRAVLIITVLTTLFIALLGYILLRQEQNNAGSLGYHDVPSLLKVTPTITVEPSATPLPSPTPAYANPVLSFGEEGIGPGMLNDARYLATDGSKRIYVADYQDGRVQAFDLTGKYLSQWKTGNDKTIIYGMAADRQGNVYVSFGQEIYRFNGETGEYLGKLSSPNGGEFGDLYVTSDGSLAAAWYEGRWGIITSLEGHRDDLVIFDAQGKISRTIPSYISSQTEGVALDVYLTVDGLGNVFAMSGVVIYHFSSQGKYVNYFGSTGDAPGQFKWPGSLAVDGQGHLFVGDFQKVHVLSAEGRYLTYFPIDSSASALAFDDSGALWVLANNTVTKYIKYQ